MATLRQNILVFIVSISWRYNKIYGCIYQKCTVWFCSCSLKNKTTATSPGSSNQTSVSKQHSEQTPESSVHLAARAKNITSDWFLKCPSVCKLTVWYWTEATTGAETKHVHFYHTPCCTRKILEWCMDNQDRRKWTPFLSSKWMQHGFRGLLNWFVHKNLGAIMFSSELKDNDFVSDVNYARIVLLHHQVIVW